MLESLFENNKLPNASGMKKKCTYICIECSSETWISFCLITYLAGYYFNDSYLSFMLAGKFFEIISVDNGLFSEAHFPVTGAARGHHQCLTDTMF